jgi:hypothetical protein
MFLVYGHDGVYLNKNQKTKELGAVSYINYKS